MLTACGSDSDVATLNWYINPDNGGQAQLAEKCTQEAGGRYQITTSILPTAADAQREQLVRRLAANDDSIDLMSLDPPFVAEFAEAGFLRPFSEEEREQFTEGILDAPVESAIWEDQLVAAPFWANTQLLWYRESVAEEAGVDPSADDFTWEQMIEAAVQTDSTIGVQAARYEGYMVWVTALVKSAGGEILDEVTQGRDAEPVIDSEAGQAAANVVNTLANSTAADPALSTAMEEQARALFQSDNGGFMVNWPYVWQAANQAAADGILDQSVVDDIAWARYPRVMADQESAPPLGGIHLGIGAFTNNEDLALEAAACITSVESQTEYMLFSGNPAAAGDVYDDPEVQEQFPMAELIRDSIDAAGPRPTTPYYTDVSSSIQRTWHPPSEVQPQVTPPRSAALIEDVLHDRVLL